MEDKKKLYLFECGNFYIFLADDAEKINKLFDLKLTIFANDVYKCGFPKNSLDKYLNLFKEKKLKIKVIESIKEVGKITQVIDLLKSIDINTLNSEECFSTLKKLKQIVE